MHLSVRFVEQLDTLMHFLKKDTLNLLMTFSHLELVCSCSNCVIYENCKKILWVCYNGIYLKGIGHGLKNSF